MATSYLDDICKEPTFLDPNISKYGHSRRFQEVMNGGGGGGGHSSTRIISLSERVGPGVGRWAGLGGCVHGGG